MGGQPAGGNRGEEDPSLPHVQTASDPEQMREVFQRHLRSPGGKEYEVRGCEVPFVLHARNVRFIAHYELRLGEAGGGRGFDQLVTGVMYAGARTRPVWQELAQDQPTPPPTGPARALSTQDDGHRHDDRSVNRQRPAIHPSAWKGNSANFALGGSQEFGT